MWIGQISPQPHHGTIAAWRAKPRMSAATSVVRMTSITSVLGTVVSVDTSKQLSAGHSPSGAPRNVVHASHAGASPQTKLNHRDILDLHTAPCMRGTKAAVTRPVSNCRTWLVPSLVIAKVRVASPNQPSLFVRNGHIRTC